MGVSVEGRPIRAYTRQGVQVSTRLILAGMHGDEPKSVYVAEQLIELLSSPMTRDERVGWFVVPIVNPDGYERRSRRNANRVDINRNFPTENWQRGPRRSRMFGGEEPGSEPETRALVALIRRFKPGLIITIHSISRQRQCNNYDGPGRRIAARMAGRNGYPATSTIGYPTPGSFGSWAGCEQGIPTITLELPSHHSRERCWIDNREALLSLA